jgi:hypothetical protein
MAGWVLVALAGLAIAVVLSVAASNLSTQPIGLSNEPLRAGDRLAPPPVKTTETVKKRAVKRRRPARTQTTTAPAPAVTATTPAPATTTTTPGTDDHGGSGSSGGSGSGRTDDLNGRRDSDD